MTGIVLCGGASSRMGTDKALLPAPSGNWAGITLQKLRSLGIPVALSIRPEQREAYAAVFPAAELIADHPGLSFKGPLLALISCHRAKPREDLIVLACDMPLIQPMQLQRLLISKRRYPGFNAYAYIHETRFEPLCALYTRRGLSRLSQSIHATGAGRSADAAHKTHEPIHSLQHALRTLRTKVIPIPAAEIPYFGNFNSPADLATLTQIPPSP